MNLWEWMLEPWVRRRVALAVRALDDERDLRLGAAVGGRDREGGDRETVLAEALEAWRTNPLARRLVGLTTEYVVGAGFTLGSPDPLAAAFLRAWWEHPLNRLALRMFEWSDELGRAGDLFLALTSDAAGMSYVRAIPAAAIGRIECAEADVQQERRISERPQLAGDGGYREGRVWSVYDPLGDAPGEAGVFPAVMLHYAVNRPVGALFGESDLAPLLRWLRRYTVWLEDRARLNRFRQSFMYVVQARFRDAAERAARAAEINAQPPNPGTVLVADAGENWSVLNPQLASGDSGEDGLALKKMVAVGSGNPLHFLAEPESATRTTAESAGGPTFRHYQQRQLFLTWLVGDLARAALRRRAHYDPRLDPQAEIAVRGADITSRDNEGLARAASLAAQAFGDLQGRGLIDQAELVRIVYRFAGEVGPQ